MRCFATRAAPSLAAALLLAGCVGAGSASAAAVTSQASAPPLLTPTAFTVHNRLPGTLYGFRIRTGYQRWAEVGDLPPGDSQFTVNSPIDTELGTFEFLLGAPSADADYTLGAYTRSGNGPVTIDVSPQPGTVGGQPAASPQGSFMWAPAMPSATGAVAFIADPRIPLISVPRAQAGSSEFMGCAGIGPGLSYVGCRSASLLYSSLGYGLNLGVVLGYFWSPRSPEYLQDQFPVTIYTFQLGAAYIKFLAATESDPSAMENVGQFVGLGPALGAALNWGGFSMNGVPMQPRGNFRKTCGNIEFDAGGQELSAQCETTSGAQARSVLEYATCLGGDVSNDDGNLRCELPAGSYQSSCQPIRVRDGVLQASCLRSDGSTRVASSLDLDHACEPGSGVSNVDGQLRCDQPWLPPGPYLASCRNIRYADGVLQADCGGLDTHAAGIRLDYADQCKPRSAVTFIAAYAQPGRLACVEPRQQD